MDLKYHYLRKPLNIDSGANLIDYLKNGGPCRREGKNKVLKEILSKITCSQFLERLNGSSRIEFFRVNI